MSTKNYIITDKKLLKKGGNECLKSALNHLEAAKLLSEKEMFGLACSHLVLAAEEASKAYILLARVIMGNKKKKNFKDYFTKHKVKQDFLQGFSVFVKLIDTMYQDLFKWQFELEPDDLTDEELERVNTEQEERVKNHIEWLKAQMEDKSDLDNLSTWWQHANQLKNTGFYVDYNNANWQSPQEITSTEYDESFEIVNIILDKVNAFSLLIDKEPEKLKGYHDDFLEYMDKSD